MDFKVEAAVLRKAGHEGDTAVLSPAHGGWHDHQQCPPPSSTAAQEGEPYCAACTDPGGGLLWELDFSVDDLLDLGGDVGEEQHGAEGEELLLLRDGEVEGEGEDSGGTGWCNSINTSSTTTSATVALPPSSSDLVAVPAGDVEDLEWVSRFVDDSYSEFAAAAAAAAAHAPPFANLHAPAPPVSAAAVETGAHPKASSTSSGTPLKRSWHSCSFSSTASVAVPAKARSKRPRAGGPRVWSLRRTSCFLSESSSSSCSSVSSSSSCSVFSSVTSSLGDGGGHPGRLLLGTPRLGQCLPQAVKKKKKGRKPKVIVPAATAGGGNGGDAEQQARRRCSHCGVDKTPQWRAGPMGAKTLCNACGVRYKSGRLLPEYRPAGSPTFLSHVHSNSHRKVLEIRRSKEPVAAASPAAASCLPSPPQQPAGPTRPYGVV